LSQRTDSAFWVENRDSASIPDSLKDKLAMWRARPPHRLDFITDLEMYPPASWQFVLYGMEFATDMSASRAAYPRLDEARQEFAMIRKVSASAMADLPDHRALLDQIHTRA